MLEKKKCPYCKCETLYSNDKLEHCFNCNMTKFFSEENQDKVGTFNVNKLSKIEEGSFWFKYITEKRKINKEFITSKYIFEKDGKMLLCNEPDKNGNIDFYQYKEKESLDINMNKNKDYLKPKYISVKDRQKPVMYLNQLTEKQDICICEGAFSAISFQQITGVLSCAIFGKNLSSYQVQQLKSKFNLIKTLYICLDGDCFKDMCKIYKQLDSFTTPFECKIVKLQDGADPNDYLMYGLENHLLDIFQNHTI